MSAPARRRARSRRASTAGAGDATSIVQTAAALGVLVDNNDEGYPRTYSQLAAATGLPVTTVQAIPTGGLPYACVILSLDEAPFTTAEVAAMRTYLDGGGNVLATGDYGSGWAAADNVMNTLAASLGATMSLDEDTERGGSQRTSLFPP